MATAWSAVVVTDGPEMAGHSRGTLGQAGCVEGEKDCRSDYGNDEDGMESWMKGPRRYGLRDVWYGVKRDS